LNVLPEALSRAESAPRAIDLAENDWCTAPVAGNER
jgi:hypothetical protein